MPVAKTLVEQWGWGCYPAGYNRVVHGPYNPARYYGPQDTAFGQVKLAELGSWLSRRDKSPRSIANAISRARFRWQHNFVDPRKAKANHMWQTVFCISAFFYLAGWKTLKHHRSHKYHW